MKMLLGVLVVAAAAGACAPQVTDADIEQKLKAATASALGGSVDPASVTVSNRVRTQVKHTWTAGVDGKSYTCDVDDQFAWPSCAPAA